MSFAPEHPRSARGTRFSGKLILGLAFVALGTAKVLDNLNLMDYTQVISFTPLLLVALGLQRLWVKGITASLGPHILLLLGIGLQLIFRDHTPLVVHWWPLGLVWLGLVLVLRALWPTSRAVKPGRNPEPRPVCQDDSGRSQ